MNYLSIRVLWIMCALRGWFCRVVSLIFVMRLSITSKTTGLLPSYRPIRSVALVVWPNLLIMPALLSMPRLISSISRFLTSPRS